MGLYGYPEHNVLFLGGFNSMYGDDRVFVCLLDKHKPLLDLLWKDLDLCKKVADLLMESADINHYYLGHRLLKISKREEGNGRDTNETNQAKKDNKKEDSGAS